MSSPIPRLRGAYTALVTPFLPDGSLDEEAIVRLVERQIDKGINGPNVAAVHLFFDSMDAFGAEEKMIEDVEKVKQDFLVKRTELVAFCNLLESLIKNLLEISKIDYDHIEARTKAPESFNEKIIAGIDFSFTGSYVGNDRTFLCCLYRFKPNMDNHPGQNILCYVC